MMILDVTESRDKTKETNQTGLLTQDVQSISNDFQEMIQI
jgi:hypothetical protein